MTMDEADEEILRKAHVKLAKIISEDLTLVVEELYANKIINDAMKQRVQLITLTPLEQAFKLLLLLRTRGPHAFQAFYDAVLQADIYGAADLLKPELAPHMPDYTPASLEQSSAVTTAPSVEDTGMSEDEDLPDHWPLDVDKYDKKIEVKTLHSSSRPTVYQRIYDRACGPEGQKDFYQMLHKNRGLCLIINNENFDQLEDRDGSDKDAIALNYLFRGLGFADVRQLKNKKSVDMERLIKKEVQGRDHTNSDCLVLVILSHGREGVVFGTDGYVDDQGKPQNCVTTKDIFKIVCGQESLNNKPKLIFLQACRGTARNKGLTNDEKKEKTDSDGLDGTYTDGPTEKTDMPSSESSAVNPVAQDTQCSGGAESDIDLDKLNLSDSEKSGKADDEVDASGEKVRFGQDCFIARSTIEDYVSMRNTVSGTWFIQAMVYVFSRFAYKHNLNKLMLLVNTLVSRAESEKNDLQICDIPPGTMLKDVHFFPSLYKC